MKIRPLHIIVILALLVTSSFLSIYGSKLPKIEDYNQINVEHIETVISEKIGLLESQCKHISEKLIENHKDAEKCFYDGSTDAFNEEGIGFFYIEITN